MGFSRALALLHALLHAHEGAAGARRLLASDDKAAPPFPHLQQRLRQTARGAALTAAGAVAAPLALLTLVPAASPWAFPGVIGFSALGALLVALAVLQVALRFVLLPAPRQALTADPLTAMQGVAQTAACALVDVAAPLHRDPQLLLLLLFCVAQTWVWKTALYYVALPSDAAADDFGSFVLISGLVTFVSWLAVEPRLDQDPFVLDPRSSFLHALQRDVVRAARRGVVSYFAARLMLVVFGASLSVSGILGQIFTINLARAFFQITTSFLESFAALATASIFRILLFRANYAAVAAAATGGKLWDIVGAHVKAQSGITTLFTKDLDVSTNAAAGLDEQYVSALGKRTDSVMKAVARTDALSIGSGSGSDKSVEDMNALFAFENLLLSSKFNTDNRKTLYSSHKRWHSLFQSTTAVIDSFTVSLQLLNSIPTRKNQVAPNDSQAFEQSIVVLLKFLAKNSEADPLLLLHQYPHLSNLRISSSGFKSKIRYYVESRIQFAVRRFLMQEAKRHIFRAARGVEAAQVLLCHLVSKSRNEDVQGNVKYTVPAAMASLVECRKALDAYMESCLKDDSSTDIYIKEAATLAKGIDNGVYKLTNAFYAELHAFTFPSGISGALASYAAFTA